MIKKVTLNNVATFKNKVEFSPNLINYIYGFNGSGKTTISNVLSNPSDYVECSVEKEQNDSAEMVIYNKNFVDQLFTDSSKLKGIYTFGKDSGKSLEIIDKSKEEMDRIEKENLGLRKSIDRKNQEKDDYEKKIKDDCWRIRNDVVEKFKDSLTGFTSTKDKFKTKCLQTKKDIKSLKDIKELEEDYKILFGSENHKQAEITKIKNDLLLEIESDNIFNEVIKGNDETSVSELINKLNNSDWVKQGLSYLKESDNICPFCQQELGNNIKHLIEYFDEKYEEKCNKLKELKDNYEVQINNTINAIESITSAYEISNEKIELLIEKLKNIFNDNLKNINMKIDTPSKEINLSKSDDILKQVNEIFDNFNIKIKENNYKIDNISEEKESFKDSLWNYIINELDTEISVYRTNISNVDKALTPMNEKLNLNNKRIEELKIIIKENEKKITGIEESLIEINRVLTSFGFDGFRLEEGKIQGTYKIVRSDGTDVGNTLSEGEYRFISFLYYYYLTNGSIESSGITRDKILVIDDPISSLDSNTLFIVSTLVKKLINDCFESKNGIKQIFIMTHNVYFYKEIVYKGNRDNKKESESYFIVSKKDEISSIKEYDKNPIETTYQLLWEELKDENINRITCFNTMRRILEYYFNIVGGKNYEKEIDKFEGNDKIICKSLISCINDSSHYINEDYNVILDDDIVMKYKRVFRKIFEDLGHIEHYKMMMNEEDNSNG